MEIYSKVEKTKLLSTKDVQKYMDYSSIREYQPSRGGSRAKGNDSYLDMDELDVTRDARAPTRSRASTPSAAVRRAMQVLDETYKKQSYLKQQDRWSRSAEHGSFRPIRTRRSPSPIRSRSRSPSPVRSSSPCNWTPPRIIEIERDNFHDALDDSESRREILLRKLADAQKTMEMQNERLREGEMDVGESRATIRLLQQVQQELETKTEYLEKERNGYLARSRHNAEEREAMKRKMDDNGREMNRLRCQLDLLLADKEQHHVTLEHLHKTINDLKTESKDTLELQASTGKDLDMATERLAVCKQKCELLEKEKNHAFSEIEKQQKSQQALINRNTELSQRLKRCEIDLQDISERYDRNTDDLGHCKEELGITRDRVSKQAKDLTELRRSHAEMQQDRERALKYNAELEKTVHSIKEINIEIKRARVACEDEMTDLHSDLAKARIELARTSDENKAHFEQAKTSMKECAKLTSELNQLRPRVDELSERVKYFESTHNMDLQQVALLETQKQQVARERDDLNTRLTAQQESYDQLQTHHNEESKRLNQQVKDLQHEREKLATQIRETETQLNRVNEELTASTQHNQSQIDHWRQACSKLTSLVEEKDEDLRKGAVYRRDVEEKLALAEAERRTAELQLDELAGNEEELLQLRGDVKRLGQESAENQQMITVLEMQRDILAKSPSKNASQESVLKAQVEKQSAELSLLRTKLKQVEAERDSMPQKTSFTDVVSHGVSNDDVSRLKGMNKLLAEQLTKVRQEAETLQGIIEEKNLEADRESAKAERERKQLEFRLASMGDEVRALKSNQSVKLHDHVTELRGLRAEMIRLKQDLEERKQRVMVMEGERVILDNGRKRAEDRVAALEAEVGDMKREKTLQEVSRKSPVPTQRVAKLSEELNFVKATLEAAKAENVTLRSQFDEFDDVRASQDGVIEALRQQLEAHSGSSNNDSDGAVSGKSQSDLESKLKALKRDLIKAKQELAAREKQVTELKRKFVEMQRAEQRARQERDELQGKTIIMESMNDSSQDLLKELDEVRHEKDTLEKQLSIFMTSKTSQTPPNSLCLTEDLDKELENQYQTVVERNKWLETRIASLQREIELVRDQNSLLQEQRNAAEREATKLREDMKALQINTKGTRRKSEVEQIHLQHSNADKIQQIIELERDLSEKKQIIHAMAREMESLRKKSDKGKISSFMKKLKGSSGNSTSTSRDLDRSTLLYTASTEGDPQWTARSASQVLDTGYSTMTSQQQDKKRSSSLSPKARPASFSGLPQVRRNSSQPPVSRQSSRTVPPVSPTLTYVTNIDDVTLGYPTPSPKRSSKNPQQRHHSSPRSSSSRQASPTRVSFDESSDPENGARGPGRSPTPSPKGRKHSSREPGDSEGSGPEGDNVVFFADDYLPGEEEADIDVGSTRSASTPVPSSGEPQPTESVRIPSPASSPSLPSPLSGRKRSVPVYVTAASDESGADSESLGSGESEQISGDSDHDFPPPTMVKPAQVELQVPRIQQRRNSPPPRPQSQPILKQLIPSSSKSTSSRKKHSSLK